MGCGPSKAGAVAMRPKNLLGTSGFEHQSKKASGGTYSYEVTAGKSLLAVREKAAWSASPWLVERPVPEIGDLRTYDLELPGFGHVKTVEKCLKYESNDCLYMHEYRIEESTLLPVGYVGNLQIVVDSTDAHKVHIAYKATWGSGHVSDALKELIKATLDDFASGGTYSYEVATDKSFEAVCKRAKWDVHPWSVERPLPEIGDLRKCDLELDGFGRVKTVEKCLNYDSTDQLYMHSYEVEESSLLPVGYVGTLQIAAAFTPFAQSSSGHPSMSCPGFSFRTALTPSDKVIISYKGAWSSGEVSDAVKALLKATVDDFAAQAEA